MTPKEKAQELVDKFQKYAATTLLYVYDMTLDESVKLSQMYNSKQCALIAVNELIDAIDWHEFETPNDQLNFWSEVKTEIEKF